MLVVDVNKLFEIHCRHEPRITRKGIGAETIQQMLNYNAEIIVLTDRQYKFATSFRLFYDLFIFAIIILIV